ncbi:MAG: Tlg2-vesicle protein [Trizodia sp. TS-e1964]|nr:MAG: Tlg2-vesicle protein [Trizodia sp. TS-e1964]
MSSEYSSTARALALPVDSTQAPTRSTVRPSLAPQWSRSRSHNSYRSNQSSAGEKLHVQIFRSAGKINRKVFTLIKKLTLLQKLLLAAALVLSLAAGILFLLFNQKIFEWLLPFAVKWRSWKSGWIISWLMVFFCAFPPLIGYSTSVTIAGFVFGFPNGWYIAASASVLGALFAFIISRTLLSSYVHRLIADDKRFAALALTLKHDGLQLLIMIRLCPLPYSLSNGAMSTFPTVHPLMFALATAISTPKLLIHVFIGSRLAIIAEKGEEMDTATTILNYASIVGGALLGAATGYFIYQRTMARSQQLEAEEQSQIAAAIRNQSGHGNFADDLDEAAISSTAPLDGDEIDFYEDDYYDDEDDDVFEHGDGDQERAIGLARQNSGRPRI